MSIIPSTPDYALEDVKVVTSQKELRALAHRIRDLILELLLERAATVSELAEAIGRPPSTIAYHVDVLMDAGYLKVVRTRRVRAIEERYYGRTARVFLVGKVTHEGFDPEKDLSNLIAIAAHESEAAHREDRVRAILRHARIPRERAAEFWDEVLELTRRFSATPRGGDTSYGFVAGLYPTEYPTLPEAQE